MEVAGEGDPGRLLAHRGVPFAQQRGLLLRAAELPAAEPGEYREQHAGQLAEEGGHGGVEGERPRDDQHHAAGGHRDPEQERAAEVTDERQDRDDHRHDGDPVGGRRHDRTCSRGDQSEHQGGPAGIEHGAHAPRHPGGDREEADHERPRRLLTRVRSGDRVRDEAGAHDVERERQPAGPGRRGHSTIMLRAPGADRDARRRPRSVRRGSPRRPAGSSRSRRPGASPPVRPRRPPRPGPR